MNKETKKLIDNIDLSMEMVNEKLWITPKITPINDRDVLVKVKVGDYGPMYKVCHYENGKWVHMFYGYEIKPKECPWVITGWRDIEDNE